jgi:zinc transporter ZupT
MVLHHLGLAAGGGLLIAVATLAGAWLARRHAARRELCFAAAAGALLVIAGVHLLPDAWSAARQAALPLWTVPAAAAAAFAAAGLLIRRACACQPGTAQPGPAQPGPAQPGPAQAGTGQAGPAQAAREAAGGMVARDTVGGTATRETVGGTAAAGALAVHRLLEGAALALAGSVAVTVALAVHALAEGLAAGTLLTSASGRRRALWLTAMCASPVVGASLAAAWPVPASVQPVLLAVAAGVLGQAARVSLAAAFRRVRPLRLAMLSPAAATVIAAALTTLAVRIAG